MEIVKNPKANVIAFLICFVLLLFASCAFGQVMEIKRDVSYNPYYKKEIVTKYPSYGLDFADGKDTTYLSILSDSISLYNLGVRIYVYYSNKIIPCKFIKIGFEDGSEDYLRAFEVDRDLRYVEYIVPQEVFNKMYKLRVDKVWFTEKLQKIEDSLYFFAFVSNHNR